MSAKDNARALVERLVAALAPDACKDLVVVGGTAPALYEGVERVPLRMTEDVDVVVPATTYVSWRRAVTAFEDRGFRNESGDPICRYRHGDLVIDILPSDPTAIGLKRSDWFSHVHTSRTGAAGIAIDVVDPLILCALKLEAHDDRATGIIGGDKDVEDIVALLANVDGLISKLHDGGEALHVLLRGKFRTLFEGDDGLERLQTYVPGDRASQQLASDIHGRLMAMFDSGR